MLSKVLLMVTVSVAKRTMDHVPYLFFIHCDVFEWVNLSDARFIHHNAGNYFAHSVKPMEINVDVREHLRTLQCNLHSIAVMRSESNLLKWSPPQEFYFYRGCCRLESDSQRQCKKMICTVDLCT